MNQIMITTFGEIMLRISPNNLAERLTQATSYRIEPGGSESNVAIALSNLGLKIRFVTSLPDNNLSYKILQYLNQFSISTNYIRLKGEKLGLYWTEIGIGVRNSCVIYDRENSSFCNSTYNDYDWDEILRQTDWFHFSGISPALSRSVMEILQKVTSKLSSPFSVDLNFREKLWEWLGKDRIKIQHVMSGLCENATLIGGNETDFQNVLNIESNHESEDQTFIDIANKCFAKFINLRYIAISNRKSSSATQNYWNGFLFVKDDSQYFYKGITYSLDNIQDRVGTGDSFIAGIIFGILNNENYCYQEIIDFAVTLAALNHSTIGDASRFSKYDVQKTLASKGSGRILR
jgi:2-dehydro-3-deoxygluconokinase